MDMKPAVVLMGLGALWGLWKGMKSFKKSRTTSDLNFQRVVAIVDSQHEGLLSKLDKLETQSSISQKTFIAVKDAFDQLETAEHIPQNIYVVIHTLGGSLSAAEAICRRILLARSRGTKVYCYIPYFAYSAGCMIASACDEIRMSESAFLGPADAQTSSKSGGLTSVNAICKTVEFQLDKCSADNIKAKWYAAYTEAKSTRERQEKWINEMVAKGYFTEEAGASIYAQLFSGQYNHDQVIHPTWAQEIGLPVVIVTEMPAFVAKTLKHFNALAN